MFRSFTAANADAAWQQVAAALRVGDGVKSQASRSGRTREILHAAIAIENPRQRWVGSRKPPLNLAFALAEVVWILGGRDDSFPLVYFNSRLPAFAGEGPTFHGAYGHRLREHLGFDQLRRAYDALRHNPESRQIVLQIWDARTDLPRETGEPASPDIPCNLFSMLKVREGALEWTQVLRSNDLFLGLPHNLVQWTSMQEVVAGWLGLEVGSYNHLADSLHVYERDLASIEKQDVCEAAENTDNLAMPWQESRIMFMELNRRLDVIADHTNGVNEVIQIANWPGAPPAGANILHILCAEGLRRRKALGAADEIVSKCSNPAYRQLWLNWRNTRGSAQHERIFRRG